MEKLLFLLITVFSVFFSLKANVIDYDKIIGAEYVFSDSPELCWKDSKFFADLLKGGVVRQRILLESNYELARLAGADALSGCGKNNDAKFIYAELILFSNHPLSAFYSRINKCIKNDNYTSADLAAIAALMSSDKCSSVGLSCYAVSLPDSAINYMIEELSGRIRLRALGVLLEEVKARRLKTMTKAQLLLDDFKFSQGNDRIYYFTSAKRRDNSDVALLRAFYATTTKENKMIIHALYKDILIAGNSVVNGRQGNDYGDSGVKGENSGK